MLGAEIMPNEAGYDDPSEWRKISFENLKDHPFFESTKNKSITIPYLKVPSFLTFKLRSALTQKARAHSYNFT